MLTPHLISVTARSAALRLAPSGARYRLDPLVAWALTSAGDTCFGTAETVVIALHDLAPDSEHRFEAEGFAPLTFRTAPCAGLVEAAGLGAGDNTTALTEALKATPFGGALVIPPGYWTTGSLFLTSGITLHLAEGATLAARASRDGSPILPARDDEGRMLGSWEGEPAACYAALITAVRANHIAITGPGTLDGGGDRGDWWTWPKATRNGARRARTIHLIGCEGVALIGPTVRNSPSWTIHPQGCRHLTAAALKIEAPPESPNTDGFNPESCEDVTLEGIQFSVGDDCIAIKAGKRGMATDHLAPTRYVAVRHCLMERGHGGVVIGSEMSGGVSDVSVEHCEMVGTDRGLRLKTRRGRGGRIERISMTNVTMDGVLVPFSANAFYHCDADGHDPWVQSREPAPVDVTTPEIVGIRIRDIEVRNLATALGTFLGLPERPIRDARIERVTLVSTDPSAGPALPVMADHLRPMRHELICAENAEVTTDDPALLSDRPLTAMEKTE
jgi:polygalacturonase